MSFSLYLGLAFLLIGAVIVAAAVLRRRARRAKVERSRQADFRPEKRHA